MESAVKNNGISPASPTVLPAAERREAERSEADRSAAAGKTARRLRPRSATQTRRSSPTPSVAPLPPSTNCASWPKPTPRPQPGAIGALLRREGLYSSHLVTWRRERDAGILKGLTPTSAVPSPSAIRSRKKTQKLRRENERLTEQLRKAEIIIDVQKKVAALLGRPLPKPDPEEKS